MANSTNRMIRHERWQCRCGAKISVGFSQSNNAEENISDKIQCSECMEWVKEIVGDDLFDFHTWTPEEKARQTESEFEAAKRGEQWWPLKFQQGKDDPTTLERKFCDKVSCQKCGADCEICFSQAPNKKGKIFEPTCPHCRKPCGLRIAAIDAPAIELTQQQKDLLGK